MQNHYNLLYREEEREMFPTLKATYFFALICHSNKYLELCGRSYPLVSSCSWSSHSATELNYEAV